MKRYILISVLAAFLSSCALTPTQKKAVGIGAAIIVTGAIAANQSDNRQDRSITPNHGHYPCNLRDGC